MPDSDQAEMSTSITIVGGVYHESCIWPTWDQIYGSGGRAAAAISGHVDRVLLRAYYHPGAAQRFMENVRLYGFSFDPVDIDQAISFEYIHSLSVPSIQPTPSRIRTQSPIVVSDDVVLRFGMMEGSARVTADRCVYDPQSAFSPERFDQNGSKAAHLAIVANRGEILSLTNTSDPDIAAELLLKSGVEVIVVKSGVDGAFIYDGSGKDHVPAYRTNNVFTIGTGDVFAAMFAAHWGVHGKSPKEAADLASRGVAAYVDTMTLPVPPAHELIRTTRPTAVGVGGLVYLAGPFFTLGQRWLIDESRRCLREMGLKVFSPVHDVGPGKAEEVAQPDLDALSKCDVVFGILDGLDSGTLFEIGYARAEKKPVYALAQAVSEEDLKMVVGSKCNVFDDFVTALHRLSWRT
jgi:nucleoside 2-deoxyribosyltransferase